MAGTAQSSDGLAAAVRELAAAETVAFAGVGFAGQLLPVTEAYLAVEAALPHRVEELQPRLAWLLAHGSPAGRAYAATLLSRFDPAAGRAAWESLTRDHSEFTTAHGCLRHRVSLAEYAVRQLTAGTP
ncbi:hypothetical protein AB0J86_01725 [Micromonospora sp. NPDC049559]|uniref:hypothetical protein n=1 Tax=Micromonospora sp. NPDC049559 TaxID=3155923 RepID=UPI00343F8DAA